jgi:hypothetical protein
MSNTILAVGRIIEGEVHWRIPAPVALVTHEDTEAAAYYGFDDDAPSLGLVFTPSDEDESIEADADFIRFGGA